RGRRYRDRRNKRGRWAGRPSRGRGWTWSNSENGLKPRDQGVLRAGVGGCDEDSVVAGDGAGDLGPLRPIDGDGDALRRADRGPDHGERWAGAPQPTHELREHAEVAVGA